MFREMRIMLAAQNHRYSSPGAIAPEEAVRIATKGGAEALGIEDITGSIEIGKSADIIVLKPDHLKLWPFLNPYQAIVYALNPEDVKYVFINGKPIVLNEKLISTDEERIINLAQSALKELKPI